MIPRLAVGLGNPGAQYDRTRHNAGFMVVDELAKRAGAGSWELREQSLVSEARIGGQRVLLAKPLTYMNLSGHAVRLLLGELGSPPDALILILDDLNLPFGRIRIRRGGSAGGHRGLDSVIDSLGSAEFLRIRLGIAEETMPEDKTAFVLSDFPDSRREGLEEMIGRAASAVGVIVCDGVEQAMTMFNTR
ncbi:MAG: aminoacyl-tRNA hydrolase [Acidobacteria bacterium]|nr:aminoacyl-tRNA hydrolase [Acidobacteriota bacterium]